MKTDWQNRARFFNSLAWAQDRDYLSAIMNCANFLSTDHVLDAGSGTGILANFIAPHVATVVCLDTSPHMLAKNPLLPNVYLTLGDIRTYSSPYTHFNKVTMRSTLHHITTGTDGAMTNCYRLLKPGGNIILAEAIPPTNETLSEWEQIQTAKEDRIVFSPQDLLRRVESAGFKITNILCHTIKNFSINNWLQYSGLSTLRIKEVTRLHRCCSKQFARDSNMQFKDGDILIDSKQLILVGEKTCN